MARDAAPDHSAPPATEAQCLYCADWNRAHPDEPPKTACGPCEFCGEPGHIGCHPRRPTSMCLCERHWRELSTGFHFELYHLIPLIVLGLLAAIIYPQVMRWLS